MSFQTLFFCEKEYWKHVFLKGRKHFPYLQKSQFKEKEKNGDNKDAVLNVISELESESAKIKEIILKVMFFR